MSFTGVFGLVLLAIVALALLGPAKLPAGIEQLWLMVTNFRRSQADQDPLTLEQARRVWQHNENPLYDVVQILYGTVEHLVELRYRIFFILGTVVVGAIVTAIFVDRILLFLQRPAGDTQWIFLKPTDMIWVRMEVIFSAALVVALPMLLYQLLMFIRPALEAPREITAFRMVAVIGTPMVLLFFAAGLAFAYYVLLPVMLPFLLGTGGAIATPTWDIRPYYSFVLAVLLWIGVAFETPLVMAIVAWLGIISPMVMMKQWKYAFVGIAFVAAAITPTVDPVNMGLVMGPLLALYFLGVLMARAVYRPRFTSQ
ncbi:MAG: twin-arginine translocase subunit TatC [Anaerolineae bacterium]|jgi:sec-independent protein translocase protein TatC|nr:twin-arginine translocase subunit TatC [Anaerolineae bacterium]